MPILARLFDFTPGTIIASGEVDSEFNQIVAALTRTTLHINFTSVGNVGGGVDDLMSFSIPAGTLSVNGDYLEFQASGFLVGAGVETNTLDLLLNGVSLATQGAIDHTDGVNHWKYEGKILRTSATTGLVTITQFIQSNASGGIGAADRFLFRSVGGLGFTWANANILKCTGANSAGTTDRIIQQLLTVDKVKI